MSVHSAQSRSEPAVSQTAAGSALLLIGIAQIVLVLLAVVRILDPGWGTTGAIGVLVGLGMAVGAFAYKRAMPSRKPTAAARFGTLAALAGLVLAGVWLSLLGGTFYTDDISRLVIVVLCDAVFAAWMVMAYRLWRHGEPTGTGLVASLLSLRTFLEILLFLPLVIPSSDRSGPDVLVIVVAGLVLFGWVVLAVWEMMFGVWLVRRSRDGCLCG